MIQVLRDVGLAESSKTPECEIPFLSSSPVSHLPYSSSPINPMTLTEAPSALTSLAKFEAPPGRNVSPM